MRNYGVYLFSKANYLNYILKSCYLKIFKNTNIEKNKLWNFMKYYKANTWLL